VRSRPGVGFEGTIADSSRLTRLLGVAAVLLAAALVWVAAGGLRWPARAVVVFLLTFLPAFLAAQEREVRRFPAELSRGAIYASTAATLWVLAALVFLVGLISGFPPAALGMRGIGPGPLVLWTVGVTGAGLLLLVLTRALRIRESPMLIHMLPRSRAERLAFTGLAVTAGVTEEMIFRGFLLSALAAATGSAWFAAVVASAVFGFLHSYQNLVGALRAGLLGFGLALPVMASGSLLPSILAHAAYDLVAGVFLSRRLLRVEDAGTQTRRAGIG